MTRGNALSTYLKEYIAYHRTTGNKVTHFVGIPMIVFSLLGLLDRVAIAPHFSLATLLWVAAGLFYCRLHLLLGIVMLVLTAGLWRLSMLATPPILWGLFVVGWIVQFIGHYVYEGRSPAFFRNFTHLLIGPVFIVNSLFKFKRL